MLPDKAETGSSLLIFFGKFGKMLACQNNKAISQRYWIINICYFRCTTNLYLHRSQVHEERDNVTC